MMKLYGLGLVATVELTKFLAIVNDVSNTTANVPSNALTTKNAVRRLDNN